MSVERLKLLAKGWGAAPHQGVRVVCFGSSNTDMSWHSEGRHNWAGWLECALRGWVGRHILVTNAGISGETLTDLLARFDRDVRPLAPAAVIVTIGGNDAARLSMEAYRANLAQLAAEIRALGAQPVFQSYYAMLIPTMGNRVMAENFPRFMHAFVEMAARLDAPCIDQFRWFEPWYAAAPDAYAQIMRDPAHLNPVGNCLMGILAIRSFGLPDPLLPPDLAPRIADLLAVMARHAAIPAPVPG